MSGVYFVKKGVYCGGVVKFTITVGESYPLLQDPTIRLLGPQGIVLNQYDFLFFNIPRFL